MRADQPLRILLVLESHIPVIGGGGAEGQVLTLARGLRAQGHLVTILTPLSVRGGQRRVDRCEGIPVCRLGFPRVRSIGAIVLLARLAFFLLGRRHRYDAWHVHIAHNLGAVCALLGRLLDVPVVLKVAGGWETRHALAERPDLVSRIAFWCLRRATAWQAISERIADQLVQRGVRRDAVVVIPNAVDTRRFERSNSSGDAASTRFVFIGRLIESKGVGDLIDAFARVISESPNLRLQVVGGGPMHRAWLDKTLRLGLSESIEFSGHRSDIPQVLSEADFGVLPSSSEGLSNTLLETLAAGVPMLATRVSGNEDLIRDDHNGWLFEPGDVEALASLLRLAASLSAEERARMSEQARASVFNHAGVESVISRLLYLYRGEQQTLLTHVSPAHPQES